MMPAVVMTRRRNLTTPAVSAVRRLWTPVVLLLALWPTTLWAAYQPGAYLRDAMVRKAEGLALVSDALACAPGKEADAGRVAAASGGELAVVNVAWWGFDPKDATESLQTAIDTHALYCVGPNYLYPLFLPSRNVIVSDCRFAACRRGGVGIYSARDLRIENCQFRDNGPEGPGVFVQAASFITRFQGVRVHGCDFSGLSAPAIKADFGSQVRYPPCPPQRDLDVTVSHCVARDGTAPAVVVSNLFSKADVESWPGEGRRTGHWQGALRFVDCDLGTREGEAVRIEEKSALSARLFFENCILRSADAAVHVLAGADSRLATPTGGLEFIGCTAHVPVGLPVLRFSGSGGAQLTDMKGAMVGPDGRPLPLTAGE